MPLANPDVGRAMTSPDPSSGKVSDDDERLIAALRAAPQSTNRALARLLGLHEIEIAKRLRRLDESDLMRPMAVVDVYKAGYGLLAHAMLDYDEGARDGILHHLLTASAHWGVCSINSVRERASLEVTFRLRDVAELEALATEKLARIAGLRRLRIDPTIKVMRYRLGVAHLSIQRREISVADRVKDLGDSPLSADLDALDIGIIASLQTDGRESARNMARRYQIGESTIRYRLSRLSEKGLMTVIPVRDLYTTDDRAIVRLRMSTPPSHLAAACRALLEEGMVGYLATTTGAYNIHTVLIARDQAAAAMAIQRATRKAEATASSVATISDVHFFDHRWQVLGAS